MKVCLDARLSRSSGGVQQFVMGLAYGLSRLDDGDEEYFFLTNSGEHDWLRPYLSGACRIISSKPALDARFKMRVQAALPRSAFIMSRLRRSRPRASDGLIERLGMDVMHFTHQTAFLTDVPSIYQPHDLQHLHHPEFFSRSELRSRETKFRVFCEQARTVVVMTSWGKEDLVAHYGLAEKSIQVIPPAPILPIYANVKPDEDARVRKKFALPQQFIFYPAQTWAHKNHAALLEAIALLRDDHSVNIPLVCSGGLNAFYPTIQKRVSSLALNDQVRFIGFVEPSEMVSLYRMSTALVFPSKFEGWGMPICEAFWAGTPVACSNATSLPSLAGNAALLFDPESPQEIAAAILRLWRNQELRAELSERGRRRASLFSWEKTARMFRAVYRNIAALPVAEEDQRLIGAPPLV